MLVLPVLLISVRTLSCSSTLSWLEGRMTERLAGEAVLGYRGFMSTAVAGSLRHPLRQSRSSPNGFVQPYSCSQTAWGCAFHQAISACRKELWLGKLLLLLLNEKVAEVMKAQSWNGVANHRAGKKGDPWDLDMAWSWHRIDANGYQQDASSGSQEQWSEDAWALATTPEVFWSIFLICGLWNMHVYCGALENDFHWLMYSSQNDIVF